MRFSRYARESTVLVAGFNYWEPSMIFLTDSYECTAYLSHMDNKNIVVIEARRRNRNKRRAELYFGVFEGPDIAERKGGEVNEYCRQVRGLLARKNRISGRNLDSAILQALEK